MSVNPNSPFQLGMVYKTIDGRDIIIVGEYNAEGNFYYHTVIGHDLKNRYTREGETECGRCTGGPVDNPDNLVPGTGRLLTEMPPDFIWTNWLKNAFEVMDFICERAQLGYVAAVHLPSAEDPNHCIGYAGTDERTPQTLHEMVKLMQSRPVIENLLKPDSSCDTSSVSS